MEVEFWFAWSEGTWDLLPILLLEILFESETEQESPLLSLFDSDFYEAEEFLSFCRYNKFGIFYDDFLFTSCTLELAKFASIGTEIY